MPLLSTVYTSEAKLNRFLSSAGVISFADHDEDGTSDSEVVNDAINEATEDIDLYLREKYAQADLSSSEIVSRWCTRLAAAHLCELRGNPVPVSLSETVEQITAKLERIRSDELSLPGVSLRDQDIPVMSNFEIDHNYRRSKKRVIRANSSDAPSKVSRDWSDDYGWDRR